MKRCLWGAGLVAWLLLFCLQPQLACASLCFPRGRPELWCYELLLVLLALHALLSWQWN